MAADFPPVNDFTFFGGEITKATLAEALAGTPDVYPDAQVLRQVFTTYGIGTEWSELAGSYTYGFKTQYLGDEYLIEIPIPDITVAPPDVAGRTFLVSNGITTFVSIPTINLIAGDTVTFKTMLTGNNNDKQLLDGLFANRLSVYINPNGQIQFFDGYTGTIDGTPIVSGSTLYPVDEIEHTITLLINEPKSITRVGVTFNDSLRFVPFGKIYDLTVIRGGNVIHYYPLRTDGVDYLSGNLVKDEEFTWPDNFTVGGTGTAVVNNSARFTNASLNAFVSEPSSRQVQPGSYRLIGDVDLTSGSVSLDIFNTPMPTSQHAASSGKIDNVIVTSVPGEAGIIARTASTTATVTNFKVVPLDELSPSADFSDDTGFTTLGGATITGGQAVFTASGTNSVVQFITPLTAGVTYRVALSVSSYSAGSARVQTANEVLGAEANITADGILDFTFTATTNAPNGFLIRSPAGDFVGSVDYWSASEVSDGTLNGAYTTEFQNYWARGYNYVNVGVALTAFTRATLPSAVANAYTQVFVSDLTGQAAPVYSDGTVWRRYSDNTEAN